MGFFDRFKRKQPAPIASKPEEENKPINTVRDVFSTGLPFVGMTIDQMQTKAFPVTPDNMRIVTDSGETFAMDAVEDISNNPYATKMAFTLNSQRMPELMLGWFVNQGFIGYQSCAIIAQNWLVDKCCTMPAEDAARKGWEITINDGTDADPDFVAAVKKADKRFNLNKNLVELTKFKRVFGIRVAMFCVESDDVDYYSKPFNPDGVKEGSYKGITQVDPYWMTPELGQDAVSDPSNIDFYNPTWWRIGGKRVHRSHLIVVRNGDVADILKPSYLYGGMPLTQQIYERVYAAERTANEGPQLAMTKRMNVRKMDLSAAFKNPDKFAQRIMEQAQYRDNYGLMAIGLDEEYTQHETSLADLDSVIMTQYQLVAAVANVPATKLLGTSPKGFNATGEHEIETYNQMLTSIQAHDMQPLLERHYDLLMRSEFGGPRDIAVIWNPLDEPTSKELAEVSKLKADSYAVLQATGAIDGEDIREVLVKDETSEFSGLPEREVEELLAIEEENGNDQG